MAVTAEFFPAWEPPPSFAAVPADAGLASRIDKLAEFASRNGPKFVQLTLQKQQGTDFEFLSGGEGSDYYRWILYCHLEQLDPGTSLSTEVLAARHAAGGQQAAPQLAPDVEASFTSLLGGLTGSRESIKTGKEWFMASIAHAPGLAACMARHQASLPGYEAQLHILYLANDVLLKSATTRGADASEADDPVAQAFRPVLPGMLSSAFDAGQQTPEVQQRLSTMVNFWAERKVFRKATLEGLCHGMVHHGALPEAAKPAEAAEAPTQTTSQPHDPHMGQPSTSYGQAAPYDPTQVQGATYVSQPDPSYPPQYPPPHQGQPMYPSQPPHIAPQGMPYAPPPDPGWYAPQQQYAQPYAPYGQPGMPPAPYYAAPQYAAQGPPGYAQGYAAPGQPYPYMQQPYPGQPGMPQQPGYPPQAWGSAPMQGSQPPGYAMQADSSHLQQPQPAAGRAGATAPSFPAGLIPKLVEHRLKTEPPYSPLSPLDIEAVSFQPSPEPSPYILSRLDKFAADLQGYRPRMMRADLGPVVSKAHDDSAQAARTSAPEPLPSLAAAPGAAFAGLGFAAEEPKYSEDDAFHAYRKSRSGAYREFMGRSAATAASAAAAPAPQ